MSVPLFGPGGNSLSFAAAGKKHTYQAPAWLKEFGLDAYEYQAGNGVTGSQATFEKIGEEARKHGIAMSLHAPYYISLSGTVPETRLKSVDYIRQSEAAAYYMGAYLIVIHTGSAAKITRAEAMDYARDTLTHALMEIPDRGVRFGLETMGKVNQLGTLDEVLELCTLDKTRLYPVVDFGHLNAREQGQAFKSADDYRRVFDKISNRLGAEYAQTLHCHFSKIEYTAAGEKKHLTFEDTAFGPDFEMLAEVIAADNLSPRIICESAGTMAEDALAMKNMYKKALS